jgi:DNA mismatch repair protein MutL
MPHIRQLPQSVINKIAAGEVIERPASVVKELMENAVDSGARRVDVSVDQGGSALIRVADDGCGIDGAELPLAVASHATSKIGDADDLFRVATLGFRGEALASIAEVSRFRIISRPPAEQAGAVLEVQGGAAGDVAPHGCPAGTTVEVRDLFFNTPVRRRFLKTTQTEMAHIAEAFVRVALPHMALHFTLRHNERVVHDLPPVSSWRERIVSCFGAELGDNLLWVENDETPIGLAGFVGDPNFNRANNRLQYLFLNGRHIRDRSLQHALQEAYRGLLMHGRFPVAFLRLSLPSDAVDVNVHPSKLEVRFQDGSRVYSQLLSTLRTRFLASDLTARVRPVDEPGQPDEAARPASHVPEPRGLFARAKAISGRGVVDYFPARSSSPRQADSPPASDDSGPWTSKAVDDFSRDHRTPATSDAAPHVSGAARPAAGEAPYAAGEAPAELPERERGMQIHNRYLVAESDEGLLVIDQHALHERILYERFRANVTTGRLESQRLLVPETVTLSPSEAALALEHRPTLSRLGLEIEAFGGDTILVLAYPAMLGRLRPEEVLRQAVERLLGAGHAEQRDLFDELLHMMACKAAIKAGDRLSPEEVKTLLADRYLCHDAHHCPHGRPTALVFTREELDRRFGRI